MRAVNLLLLCALGLHAQTLLFSPQPTNVLPVTGLTTWRVTCEPPVSQIAAAHVYAVLQAHGYAWTDRDVVMSNITARIDRPVWAKIVGNMAKYAGPIASGFTLLASWGPVKAKPQYVQAAAGASSFFAFVGPIANQNKPAVPALASQVLGDFISGTPTGCAPTFVFTKTTGKEGAFSAQ